MSWDERAIGVFDSGLGGISVLRELHRLMPEENLIYYGDSAFAPYGEKSKEMITKRCFHIMDFLIEKGVKAVVIACNTATSACVNELRHAYPKLIIIGMEPALKLAAAYKPKQHIIVMATAFTLKEQKFYDLMQLYSKDHTIIKLPTPKLVRIVEDNQLQNSEMVYTTLHEYLDEFDMSEIDSIVLGCTHFVYFKDKIKSLVHHHVRIVDGNEGTCRHVKYMLMQAHLQTKANQEGWIKFYNSSENDTFIQYSQALFTIQQEMML